MFEVLWVAGMVFANLWVTDPTTTYVPDGGTVVSGVRIITEARTEYGPRIFQRVPYVNRLFRTVGYSRDGGDFQRIGVDFENTIDPRLLSALPVIEHPLCAGAPGEEAILRALPRVTRGVPYIYEEFRDEIEITKEKLVDRVDPPLWFPLIGPAQLHHCQWKCTVYFTETIDATYPVPFRVKKRRAEVVYVDMDRIVLCSQQEVDNAKTAKAQASCPAGCVGAKTTAKKAAVRGATEASETPLSVQRSDRIAALDILVIETVELVPVLQPLKPGGKLIMSLGYSPRRYLQISPQGTVNLGVPFGSVRVAGLTEVEAAERISEHVSQTLENPSVSVDLPFDEAHQVRGEHLVRRDGAICLGAYGSVHVEGMTPVEAKAAVQKHLHPYFRDPKVTVAVSASQYKPRVADNPPVVRADYQQPAGKGIAVMTLEDIIRMSQKGIAPRIILRQMELTDFVFRLTVDDIIMLHDSGVCEEVIAAMQSRPHRIHGVVPANSRER